MENSTGLKSSLKTRHIVMLSLVGAIGSGLFLGSGKVIAQAGPSVLLSYILAGLTLYVVMYGVGKMVIHQDEHKAGMAGVVAPFIGEISFCLRYSFNKLSCFPSGIVPDFVSMI